jgi:succinate dehydrogenase / fumarate reductase cytochrome b subunit
MVIHLATNASVLTGPDVFQSNVDRIHALGPFLTFVEWTFIFIPILYHALYGFVIIARGTPNNSDYPYVGNQRYLLQRVTGVIAFAFIGYHVWQMHHLGAPLGGGNFDPQHATSSAAVAISGAEGNSFWIPLIYAVGVLSCVYHLANGIWTMGITWGVWISPRAQRQASVACAVFGVGLGVLSMMALSGMTMEKDDIEKVRAFEERWNEQKRQVMGDFAEREEPARPEEGPDASSNSTPSAARSQTPSRAEETSVR